MSKCLKGKSLSKNSQSKGMCGEVSLQGLYFLFFHTTQGSCEKELFSAATILSSSFSMSGRVEFGGDGDSGSHFLHMCSLSENHSFSTP